MAAAIGCAVLAAGRSRRLGRAKQLVSWRGMPLLRHVAQEARRSGCDCVAVVLGAAADDVAQALDGVAVTRLQNSGWREGMASSVRTAVAWARVLQLDALLLAVADQPHLSSLHLNTLLAASRAGEHTVASLYGQALGVPALFPRGWYPLLERLRGDQGARQLLRARGAAVIAVSWEAGALDLDTPQDAKKLAP